MTSTGEHPAETDSSALTSTNEEDWLDQTLADSFAASDPLPSSHTDKHLDNESLQLSNPPPSRARPNYGDQLRPNWDQLAKFGRFRPNYGDQQACLRYERGQSIRKANYKAALDDIGFLPRFPSVSA